MTRPEHELLVAMLESDIATYAGNTIDTFTIGLPIGNKELCLWYLTNALDIICNYDTVDKEYNILTDEEMDNILGMLEMILKKTYQYKFNNYA